MAGPQPRPSEPDDVLPSDLITPSGPLGIPAALAENATAGYASAQPSAAFAPIQVTGGPTTPLPNIQQGQSFTPQPAPSLPPEAIPGATLTGGQPVPQIVPPVAPATAPIVPSVDPTANFAPQAPRAPQPAPRAPAAPAAPAGPSPLAEMHAAAATATDTEAKQKDALLEQGQTEQKVIEAEAAAREQMARDLERKQAEQAQARAQSDAKISAARDAAAKKPYHEFELSTGKTILASLGMILGGASFDPNHINRSVDIYQNAIKQDFQKQQEEHAQLWKEVDTTIEQGRALSADQLREMSEYRLNQGLKLDAVIRKGDALKSLSRNKVGIAALDATNAGLTYERDKAFSEASRLDAAQRSTAGLQKAESAKDYAEAAKARVDATKTKGDAALEKEIKPVQLEFDKDEARLNGTSKSPGLIAKQQAIRELGDNLRKASATGDPQAVIAAVIAGREAISKLNTGAVPNHTVLALQATLQGDPSTLQERLSKLIGNPKTSQQAANGLGKELDQADESALQQIDKEHGRLNQKYNAPNIGIARTPAQRNHVAGRIGGLFSGVTTRTPQGEVPRYSENAGTAPSATPQASSGPPAGSKAGKLPDGRPAYRYPDGSVHLGDGSLVQ